MISDHESEVSWPDSDHGAVLPMTPSKTLKRKRSIERVVDPVTPASQRIIVKQLETPPQTEKRHGRERSSVQDSPSKRAARNKTAELALELDSHTLSGTLEQKIKSHLHKQDRLLEASLRSRDVLRNLLKTKDAEIASLKDEIKIHRNERETQRAMAAALRREVAHLESLGSK